MNTVNCEIADLQKTSNLVIDQI